MRVTPLATELVVGYGEKILNRKTVTRIVNRLAKNMD